MADSYSNLRFYYMYRDEQNHQTRGSVVFSNPEQWSPSKVFDELSKLLIDGEMFVPNALGIPTLYAVPEDETGDHDYHELEAVEATGDETTDQRSIAAFLAALAAWKKANPEEYW